MATWPNRTAPRRWSGSRPGRSRCWCAATWPRAVSISPTCRMSSTTTCRSMPRTMSTASAAPAARGRDGKSFTLADTVRWAFCVADREADRQDDPGHHHRRPRHPGLRGSATGVADAAAVAAAVRLAATASRGDAGRGDGSRSEDAAAANVARDATSRTKRRPAQRRPLRSNRSRSRAGRTAQVEARPQADDGRPARSARRADRVCRPSEMSRAPAPARAGRRTPGWRTQRRRTPSFGRERQGRGPSAPRTVTRAYTRPSSAGRNGSKSAKAATVTATTTTACPSSASATTCRPS